MFSIGELSRRTGVKVPTIRYYEQVGLLDEPDRTEGKQRRYGIGELERLAFIRHGRELGFSIEDIRELIDLSGHPARPCESADRLARRQLASVRQRIASLRRLEKELQRIASSCAGETVGDCYVLRALADHELCADMH